MAYQSVESDDVSHLEAGNGLEFKSYLGQTDVNGGTRNMGGSTGRPEASRMNSGFFQDSQRASSGSFWSFDYYQRYFDVDTKTVLTRCYTTLLPWSPDYLTTHTTPHPDLYGPFWTLTTVIFSLFVFSSFTASLVNYLSPTSELYEYDFAKLSVAVSLVYAYGLGVPALLWFALRYMGMEREEWGLADVIASWGYGMFVWIPVSLICIAPFWIVRYVFVGIGFFVSGYFLFANSYPIITNAANKSARLLVPVLTILHAAIASTFLFGFFNYYIPEADGSGAGGSNTPGEAANSTTTTALGRI